MPSRDSVRSLVGEESAKKMSTLEKLDLLYDNNLIDISSNGVPSFKRYLDNSNGVLLGDIWTDMNNISPHAKERVGYPTQKPKALLEWIIKDTDNNHRFVATRIFAFTVLVKNKQLEYETLYPIHY